jgi:hypothetical protein
MSFAQGIDQSDTPEVSTRAVPWATQRCLRMEDQALILCQTAEQFKRVVGIGSVIVCQNDVKIG